MLTDQELMSLLPSKRTDALERALDRRLLEVRRYFELDLTDFLRGGRRSAAQFYSHNSGAVEWRFEQTAPIVLSVYSEQLSLVVLDEPLADDEFGKVHNLSRQTSAPAQLRDFLGKRCRDVRIWTLKEDFESEEAKESAVSFVFEDGSELFYCIYLHGEDDSDTLLPRSSLSMDRVERCYSIAEGRPIQWS
jgi:hypothetical protein